MIINYGNELKIPIYKNYHLCKKCKREYFMSFLKEERKKCEKNEDELFEVK